MVLALFRTACMHSISSSLHLFSQICLYYFILTNHDPVYYGVCHSNYLVFFHLMIKLKIIIRLNFGRSASRLDNKFFCLNSKLFNGLGTHTPLMVKERRSMILKSSAGANGTGSDTPEASTESEDENAQVENLPLESKLQLKLEQKMKMKLAKKIRLRRKKLVRKRRLRKKGRWPPSKMKKNKNV